MPSSSHVLFALGVFAAPLAAQPDPYRVEQLAPGVHAVIRRVPTTGASDSNVLLIVNEHDVVVVDANIFPSSARQVIRELRKLTSKTVRYVINTHFHSDHHYGNGEWRKAYPGVEFISHPVTRDLIITDDIPSLEKNVTTEYPAVIARLRTALATGKRSNGAVLSDADRKELTGDLRLYTYFLNDVKGMRQVPATITVADSLVLHRGERRIVVKWLGRGNTPGDLIVYLPRERVVATGDLVVSPIPFGFGSFLGEWPSTFRALKALDVAKIMPGHGNVMTDWSYVDRLIPVFESIWDQVRRAVATGADLDATRKTVDLGPSREALAGADPAARRAFDRLFGTPIVEAAFTQLRADSMRRK